MSELLETLHRLDAAFRQATDRSNVFGEAAAEIARLRAIISQAATLVQNYGDGAVIYPDEQAIIDLLQEEARRG